jgi:signal peptidase I
VIVFLLLLAELGLLAAYHRRARLHALAAALRESRADVHAAPESAPGSSGRLWLSGLAWLCAGAATVLVLTLFVPHALGGSSFTVMSGSMTPTLRVGDVVVDERISPADAKVGDVVTFRDPEGSHKLITHRVRRLRISRDGTVSFVTKGDNSNAVQHWTVPASGSIGLVRLRIPMLGYAVWWTRQPLGRLVFVIIPALLLAFTEIRRVWQPRTPVVDPPPTEQPGAASV